jgi:hypothetical protein
MNERDLSMTVMWLRDGCATEGTQKLAAAELVRARREEAQQKDRIRALEVQQAELIRQNKERGEALARLAWCLREHIMFKTDNGPCWCDVSPCGRTFRAVQCDRNARAISTAERLSGALA